VFLHVNVSCVTFVSDGVDQVENGWKINLKLGGSFLIIVGVATAVLIILHKLGKINLKEREGKRSSNEYTKTNENTETKSETKNEPDDDLPKDIDEISMTIESGKLHSDDTRTGNYIRRKSPERSDRRSAEFPNTAMVQASGESDRMEHVHDIPSGPRQPSNGRMYGNNEEHESDRMQQIYGMAPRRQSSTEMMNGNVADQIRFDASMHRSYSNPGYINQPEMLPVHTYNPNTQVLYVNQFGNPIYQGQHPQLYAGSQIMPQNNYFPPNGPALQGKQVQEKGKRKKGKDKKQKSSKSVTDMRQTFPNNDPYRRTSASQNYVEEQITDADTVLY
jgi:hypothetical protein